MKSQRPFIDETEMHFEIGWRIYDVFTFIYGKFSNIQCFKVISSTSDDALKTNLSILHQCNCMSVQCFNIQCIQIETHGTLMHFSFRIWYRSISNEQWTSTQTNIRNFIYFSSKFTAQCHILANNHVLWTILFRVVLAENSIAKFTINVLLFNWIQLNSCMVANCYIVRVVSLILLLLFASVAIFGATSFNMWVCCMNVLFLSQLLKHIFRIVTRVNVYIHFESEKKFHGLCLIWFCRMCMAVFG